MEKAGHRKRITNLVNSIVASKRMIRENPNMDMRYIKNDMRFMMRDVNRLAGLEVYKGLR